MPDILEINEFFVEGNNQERSHALLHITEPSNPEERKKGYFFAVAEINNGSLEQIEHLQQMIDDLESGYYETDDVENKNAFELTLEYINRRGHHILQYQNSLTHCLIGVLRKNEVSFAYHGNPNVILFYKNNKNELEQIDVMDGQEPDLDGDHLFSSIIQGNVNIGDYLYIATPHVTDYFTHDRVQKIINTRSTRKSTEHIQKVLGDLDSDLSFGGILLHYLTEIPKTGKSSLYQEKGSDASINQLLTREKTTEEILSPPILRGVKNRMGKYKEARHKKKEKKIINEENNNKRRGNVETNFRERKTKESLLNTILISIGKALVLLVVSSWRFLKKSTLFIGRSLVLLILFISNKDNKRVDVIKNFKKDINTKKEKISGLPLLSKILFISSAILVIIFITSITIYKTRENKTALNQTYANQIQAIIDKKNAADASIIYGDDQRAVILLKEAEDIITNLPQNDQIKLDKALELTSEVNEILMKLRNITTVETSLISDLSQLNPNGKTSHLVQIDNTLIAYSEKDSNFYKINLLDNSAETKDHTTINDLSVASTPKEQDMIMFVSSDNNIAEYNKESSLMSTKDIAFPVDNVKLSDIFIYNRKLYTLDSSNNQIYRHNQTQTGYDKGTAWIKDENINIKDAVSLAVDGDLFVLKSNGEIIKMSAGYQEEFNISGLEPSLDNPSKIWTYNGLNNIYILESTNKRVVVLDKEGKMLNQYTTDIWQNPTDMIVNEVEKIIYVLDSNKIYKFGY
ncbi:MAG: hypothetical protein ABIJ23_01790 [Candidatus Magasanikbacteria bacterium]